MDNTDLIPLLWDIPHGRINELPDEFIIKRALVHGSIPLIIEIKRTYGADRVRRVFDAMKPESMPRKKHIYLDEFLLPSL